MCNVSNAAVTSSGFTFSLLAISPAKAFFSIFKKGMFGKQMSMLADMLHSSTRMMPMQMTLVYQDEDEYGSAIYGEFGECVTRQFAQCESLLD